jgi:hypothetical protein
MGAPIDTLHERFAELADQAPTGGAPPAALWARGKRAQRLRVAAVAATVLVVSAVGTGVGVGLADGGREGSDPAPAGTVEVSLPIEYPATRELPDLGDAPGPLAAIWVTPREGGGAPEVVGLVAETGVFGTLPVDVQVEVEYKASEPGIALSPDGRRIAYNPRKGEPRAAVVQDLVSGEEEILAIKDHGLWVYDWIDATHLYGSASGPDGTTDADGWAWEPGTAAKLVNLVEYPGQPYLGYGWPYGGTDLMIGWQGPRLCAEPARVMDATTIEDPQQLNFEVAVLCDVVGVVGTGTLLGHWNSEHLAGESSDPGYAEGTVVALDIRGADRPYLNPAVPRGPDAGQAFEDPARRHVVVTAGAPYRVAFATDLIGAALESAGGGS